jgi:hypothetical protein
MKRSALMAQAQKSASPEKVATQEADARSQTLSVWSHEAKTA